MRPAITLAILVLSLECLPPGVNAEFLSWPSSRVKTRSDAHAIPGDTVMHRDPRSNAKVMVVRVDGLLMIVDQTPDAELVDLWVRVVGPACEWERSREPAA